MARRSSEELLAEFHKRYDILEAIRECFTPSVNFFSTPEENGNTQREGVLRAVETDETTLSRLPRSLREHAGSRELVQVW